MDFEKFLYSYVVVGNPGVGKITILNGLMGKTKFESGIPLASIGEGKTQILQICQDKKGSFH